MSGYTTTTPPPGPVPSVTGHKAGGVEGHRTPSLAAIAQASRTKIFSHWIQARSLICTTIRCVRSTSSNSNSHAM